MIPFQFKVILVMVYSFEIIMFYLVITLHRDNSIYVIYCPLFRQIYCILFQSIDSFQLYVVIDCYVSIA